MDNTSNVGLIIYRGVDPGFPLTKYNEYDRWPVEVNIIVCFTDTTWQDMTVYIKVTNPFRVTDEEIIAKAGQAVRELIPSGVVYIGLKSWKELQNPENRLED